MGATRRGPDRNCGNNQFFENQFYLEFGKKPMKIITLYESIGQIQNHQDADINRTWSLFPSHGKGARVESNLKTGLKCPGHLMGLVRLSMGNPKGSTCHLTNDLEAPF
jgi:hypothetical protein